MIVYTDTDQEARHGVRTTLYTCSCSGVRDPHYFDTNAININVSCLVCNTGMNYIWGVPISVQNQRAPSAAMVRRRTRIVPHQHKCGRFLAISSVCYTRNTFCAVVREAACTVCAPHCF